MKDIEMHDGMREGFFGTGTVVSARPRLTGPGFDLQGTPVVLIAPYY